MSLFFRRAYLNLFCICSSALVLIISYATNNFAFEAVYLSSHAGISLMYKLSALWTTNEGSMLLWIIILSIYTAFFEFYAKDSQTKQVALTILCFISAVFIVFLLYCANPFKVFSIVPEDGLGLNPILQDVALTIHPPILYLGYVGCVICFALAIAILITKDYSELNLLNKFCLITFTLLSCGVFLGSWWSYRELGWGGFWAWDPVENISLMPWLLILGAIHSLHAFKKHQRLQFLSLFLCIASFLSSILGTFITRSGIVESVHSFANDREQGIYLLVIFSLFTVIALSTFFIRLFQGSSRGHINKNAFLMLANNVIAIALFVILLFGILYPIIVKILTGNNIYISNNFYNGSFAYLTILMVIGIILFPVFSVKNFFEKYKFSLALLLVVIFYSIRSFDLPILAALNVFGFTLIFAITEHYLRTVGEFTIKNILISRKNPFFLSHISLGIFLVGIAMFASNSAEVKRYFNVGDSAFIKNYEIELKKYELIQNENYNGIRGIFKLQNSRLLTPEFRFYKKENLANAETSIVHFLFDDIYLVISGVDEKLGLAVEIYYRSGIQILWLSFIILVAGCALKIFYSIKSR